jgi:hypothetical protein
MKDLKKCEICNHGYFEGEGCRGCYYSEFFFKQSFDKKCVDDGFEDFRETKCSLCHFPISKTCRLFNYCSLDCKMSVIHFNMDRECKQCGVKISYPSRRKVYCSKDCRIVAEKETAHKRYSQSR